MTAPLLHPPRALTPVAFDWMHDRLREAHSVLADMTRHPDSLVILAARVILTHSADTDDRNEARDVLRLLDRSAPHPAAAVAQPKGGAA